MQTLDVIAHIRTDFSSKFGIPRQSGLIDELKGEIVFTEKYRDASALRGIEGYSHLWLIWQFSESVTERFSPTVKPPRLGGNKRVSVLKYFEADSIDAYVTRIPSAEDGTKEAALYQAFLGFQQWSGLRTVEFSEPESYKKLQRLTGKEPGEIWTEEERSDFVSFYYYFHKEYVSIGKGRTLRSLCDDMLLFIERYGYRDVCNASPLQLKKLIRQPVRQAMKILAVSDDESKYYYEYYSPGKLDEFDLILACGDLHKVYLEFLTTMAPCPVLRKSRWKSAYANSVGRSANTEASIYS